MAETKPRTTKPRKKPDGVTLARLCAKHAAAKKAMDVAILDVRGLSPLTDYLVVASATSSPHLRAVRDEITDEIRKDHGMSPIVSDGNLDSQWLVVGYSDVNVHIFAGDKREFYAIEGLWNDAPRVPLKREVRKKAASETASAAS
jgi:ribosome-associated protein